MMPRKDLIHIFPLVLWLLAAIFAIFLPTAAIGGPVGEELRAAMKEAILAEDTTRIKKLAQEPLLNIDDGTNTGGSEPTYLVFALRSNKPKAFTALLQAGASPDKASNGKRPLQWAAAGKYPSFASELIAANASLIGLDDIVASTLWSTGGPHRPGLGDDTAAIVEILLKAGAKPEGKFNDNTPLFALAQYPYPLTRQQSEDILRALQDHGADLAARTAAGSTFPKKMAALATTFLAPENRIEAWYAVYNGDPLKGAAKDQHGMDALDASQYDMSPTGAGPTPCIRLNNPQTVIPDYTMKGKKAAETALRGKPGWPANITRSWPPYWKPCVGSAY